MARRWKHFGQLACAGLAAALLAGCGDGVQLNVIRPPARTFEVRYCTPNDGANHDDKAPDTRVEADVLGPNINSLDDRHPYATVSAGLGETWNEGTWTPWFSDGLDPDLELSQIRRLRLTVSFASADFARSEKWTYGWEARLVEDGSTVDKWHQPAMLTFDSDRSRRAEQTFFLGTLVTEVWANYKCTAGG